MRKLIKSEIFKILLLVMVSVTAVLLSSLTSFFIYTENLQRYPKAFSLLNLYRETIIIEIDGKLFKLKPFDARRVRINIKEEVGVRIFKEAGGTLIDEIATKEFVKENNLSIVPISPDRDFCFFSAEVDDFYYKQVDSPKLKDVRILETNPKDYYFRITSDDNIYIYPGRSTTRDLPSVLLEGQKVIGTYPLECEFINDEQKQIETINLYKTYNAESQREYYYSNLDKINNLRL